MNKPIGIFDSGLGGLTVLTEVQDFLPYEDFVYIADSSFAPYGQLNEMVIEQRSVQLAQYLVHMQNIKVLVVACNTATAAAIHTLRDMLNIPVIGMEPAIKPAVKVTKSGVIGVLATENTLKSNKFSSLLDKHQHQARIMTQPCAGWVEAIEQGDLSSQKLKNLVKEYVQPLLDGGADTLVLGCTHYPLLEPIIRQLVMDEIRIISTGKAVAKQVQQSLEQHQLLAEGSNLGKVTYYTSGEVQRMSASVTQLFDQHIDVLPLPSVV